MYLFTFSSSLKVNTTRMKDISSGFLHFYLLAKRNRGYTSDPLQSYSLPVERRSANNVNRVNGKN